MNSQPSQYTPVTLGAKIDLGVGGNIIELYRDLLDTTATEGKIIVGDTVLTTEPECVAMLKAILQAGCCRIEERAAACREVVVPCITTQSKEEFVAAFKDNPDNPFVAAIHKAIREEWGLWG